MSKQDRQKLSILVVLLVVLGLTFVFGNRINQPAAPVTAQAADAKTSASPQAVPSDARIRMEDVQRPDTDQDIGKKNVFEYRQPPPPPVTQRGSSFTASTPPPNSGLVGNGLRSTAPTLPLGPPPIPLKYQGYLALDTPTGGFTAVIADDARHYNVTVGEILMGRYRILAITDKVVDVEDLEYHRRQSLPIAK